MVRGGRRGVAVLLLEDLRRSRPRCRGHTQPPRELADRRARAGRHPPDRAQGPAREAAENCRRRLGRRMPDIGFYHPIVIHFAIGLLAGGVLLRALSLIRRGGFAGPAAVTMILLATAAIVVAAQSGEDAHVAVEAAPGVAAAVRAHQQWGERTRNVALLTAGLELLTLALRGRPSVRTTSFVSAGVGVLAFLCILETGKL